MSGTEPQVSRDFIARVTLGLAVEYELVRVIGSGAMSVVFLAMDLKHGRDVAIKVLRPELAVGIGSDRFLREIRSEASLEHVNIVPVFDSGEVDGLPYYVMPYVIGESLECRLEREPQLPLDEAVQIAVDVAAALSAAHARGILHRDINPANILLRKDRAAVTDFGVARALHEAGAGLLMTTGVAVGTPAYMSPEQGSFEGRLDPRSDQYSLACVVHEMLAGEPLFSARSPRALIFTHAVRNPPRLRDFRPEVSRSLERVVLKALAKLPADRFSSADAFGRALAAAGSGDLAGSRWSPATGKDGRTRQEARERIVRNVEHAVLERPGRLAGGVLGFGAVLIVASILVTVAFMDPGAPSWGTGQPASVVVLPVMGGATARESVLASEMADRLALGLNSGLPMQALDQGSLAGLIGDLGFSGTVFESAEDALTVAQAARVQALAGVAVRIVGDSAVVDVAVYDAGQGRLVGHLAPARAALGELEEVVDPLVLGVRGLEGPG